MQNRIFFSAFLALMAAITFLAPTGAARAMTPEQYFDDGNRLFRDDLYWAALLRYSQAAENGIDTPLLHYNTGIAHYRAGQHVRARVALLRALDDPALRVAAQYNLGLNAYALGDTEEALRWFRLVRDQNAKPRLQEFAVVAISRIRVEREKPDDFDTRAAERKKKRQFADLDLRATVSFGNDSNVFRSPSEAYIDLTDPTLPVVTPVVQTGAYLPVDLSARYMINTLPFEGFYGAYKLSGRYYQDQELENANEYLHEVSFGNSYKRKTETRERRVRSAFTIAQHDDIYYDRDDGSVRTANGVNVENRLNYLRYGPEISARQSGEKFSFGLSAKGQLWNYEETGELPEYDHEYFYFSTFGQYQFTNTSLLRFTARYYSRRYGDRPAFDLDGQQRVGNPDIRYDYVAVGMRARQRVGRSMWFGFDVERTQRTDQHLGYNNYSRDSYAAEVHWSPGRRFDIELGGVYRLYDFPNALAFHDVTGGRKTQESLRGHLLASFRVTPRISIVLDARQEETVSSDVRIQYDRTLYSLGVRWEQ